jgi:hypothetical protein
MQNLDQDSANTPGAIEEAFAIAKSALEKGPNVAMLELHKKVEPLTATKANLGNMARYNKKFGKKPKQMPLEERYFGEKHFRSAGAYPETACEPYSGGSDGSDYSLDARLGNGGRKPAAGHTKFPSGKAPAPNSKILESYNVSVICDMNADDMFSAAQARFLHIGCDDMPLKKNSTEEPIEPRACLISCSCRSFNALFQVKLHYLVIHIHARCVCLYSLGPAQSPCH